MPALFRIGLVGAGRMGRNHLRALSGSARVAVAAIAEPSPQSRRRLTGAGLTGAGPAGAGPTVHASLAEMLDRCALDGILIAAPSDQHLPIISEAAGHGLPILCEKPCGVNSRQTRAAAGTAAAAGVPLQVAYWRRFFPVLRQLRDRVAAGELGAIHLVTCYQWDERPPPAAYRAHSGGIAIDMGVHEFDQLRWLTGQDISSLSATAPALTADATAALQAAELATAAIPALAGQGGRAMT